MERPNPILALALAGGLAAALAAPARADDAAVERFAASLRFPTVSHADPADFDPAPFAAFRAHVAESFPLVHERLELEIVSGHSLLYTWPGTGDAAPILITSHYDVVPVPPETLDAWEQPPYDGVVADGYIWGRGTLDDKYGVVATLEAAERLLAAGFTPARTIYFAFGHDEEIGGPEGAGGMTDLLASRGVQLEWSLDEGMAVVSGFLSGVEAPAAMIGVAEKGFVSLRLTARAEGGHSSMPPPESAIGQLARAITRVEANPMPANLDTVAGRMLDALSPHVPGFQGFALRNRGLLGPVIERVMSARPATNAIVRTTTAVTMMNAGVKENVLPRSATAVVNFRILPGDTIESIEAHVRKVVDDPEIEIEVGSVGREASEVSSSDSQGFRDIGAAILDVFPDAVVAPGLVVGGTDSKHYARVADDAYRFGPLDITLDDASRIHGVNERISVANYLQAIDFYAALMRRSAGP